MSMTKKAYLNHTSSPNGQIGKKRLMERNNYKAAKNEKKQTRMLENKPNNKKTQLVILNFGVLYYFIL